jgi:hypothetical protein
VRFLGIILPRHLVPDFESYEFDEDISELLGLSKYEPPIPTQLAGKVFLKCLFVGSHDCEHVNVYVNDLIQGERVVVTKRFMVLNLFLLII